MYQQTQQLGIVDKLIIGLMAIVLFVAGFLASLLTVAIGCSMALLVLGKTWWMKRRTEKRCIEGEYRIVGR